MGATIIVTKELFNTQLKKFDRESTEVFRDTMQATNKIRTTCKAREAIALSLSSVVEQMMSSGDWATIVYHDDGSKQ